ncbi:GDSL-type esterase/lipase family protein [uncultured Victivallis sp.]|uniref:GDSL-type esterase/lipase family protein n=1 Tax=uncultured Victivallis sp. TaxID=354118 RepID=UPI0025E29762|nr:GDSL-type esterase/lipase family protein [uncultured Victivallis sp.]
MFRKTALLLVCVAGVHVAGGEWQLLQSGFSGIPGFFARIGEPGVLRVDTRTGRDHWNILWVNESNLLTAGNRYRISLRYRILAKEGDGGLAFIARPCNVEHHREDLHAENGTAGEWSRVQFEVRIPEDAVPYTLQIHAWGKIAAEIDSLKISRAGSPFRVVRPEVAEADKVPTGSVEFEVRRPHFPADPVVVDGAEFGFSETAEDNTPAWERAMAACRKRNASRLILPSGTFRFLSPNPLKIERFHDFEIDGNGAQFIFYRAEKSMHSSFMALSFNRRFAMRNLRIDWDWERMPLASVVRARRVDPLRHWVELEFTQYEDVPFRDVMRIADVEQLDPVTMSVGCENSKGALFEFIPGAYPPADMEWTASNRLLLRRNTAQQSHFFENIHPGELFRMRHFSYDSGAFHLDDNQEIVLEDITIFGAPGFGVLLTGRDQKFVELRRVKVIPPKGSERCISSCADPVHSSQSSGFLKLEDCEFGFSGDDCVNIADTNGLVTVTAPDRLQLSTISLGTFRVGDPLELRELNFAPTGHRVTVRRLLPDGRNDGSGSLEISEPLPPELTGRRFVVFNRAYGSRNIIIRNCFLHNNRARGVLLHAGSATIENNRFFHNQAGGMQIGTGYMENFWGEGFGVDNVVIRNNVFDSVNVNSTRANGVVRDVEILTYALPEPAVPVESLTQNILFEGNTFLNPVGAGLYASGVRNLFFRDNRIINRQHRAKEFFVRGSIVLDRVEKGVVRNNMWNLHKLNENAGIAINDSNCRKIEVEGNRQISLPLPTARCRMEAVSSREIRVIDDTGRSAVLAVELPEAESVVGERYESILPFAPDQPGWMRGTVLRQLVAAECSAAGALIPESVVLKGADGTLMERGRDYEIDPVWGTVGRLPGGRIREKDAVSIDYRFRNARLDAVVRREDGTLMIRTGVPAASLPQLPPLRYGEQLLGRIYFAPGTATLNDDALFPILETTMPGVPPVAEELLPRTLEKLRAGKPLRILVWGDSVTAGTWLQPGERIGGGFAAALRKRFTRAQIELITVGWPGRNSSMFFSEPVGSQWNYATRVLDPKPDLIVMEFVNDADSSPESWRENYSRVLEDARKIGAELILIAPHYICPDRMGLTSEKNCDDDPLAYVRFLRDFAQRNRIALADVSRRYGRLWRFGIPYTTWLVNGINHPDAEGMRQFLDALMELFPLE